MLKEHKVVGRCGIEEWGGSFLAYLMERDSKSSVLLGDKSKPFETLSYFKCLLPLFRP